MKNLFKFYQRECVAGYDTFGTLKRAMKKSGMGNRIARRRMKRQLEHENFYEGFEEFIEENKKEQINDNNSNTNRL